MNDLEHTLPRRRFLSRMLAALGGVALLGRSERVAEADSLPCLGEIRMFAGDYAPLGWAFCEGQLLSVTEYDSLFALIGTTYGGDGQVSFGLPDLRGRAPIHFGTGPGGVTRTLAEAGGSETIFLTVNQIPAHAHSALANSGYGFANSPAGQVPAASAVSSPIYTGGANTTLAAGVLALTGGSSPHGNMQPYLAINFIIALYGATPTP